MHTTSLRPSFTTTLAVSLSSLVALLAGCETPTAISEDLDEAASALCPAPNTAIDFDATAVTYQTGSPTYRQPNYLVAGDFNGDGSLDAVSIDGRDNVLRFHAGTGSGLAGGFESQVLPATSSLYNPQGGAALDYDGDNDLDIAYVAQGGSSVVIALNNGLGGFTGGPTQALTGMYGLKRAAAGDFDEDGRTDIVAVASASNRFQVVLHTAAGLTPLPAIALPTGASPLDISADDLDNDGHLDLVIGSATSGQSLPFHIYQGHGDGTFSKVPSPAPRNQSGNGPSTYGLVVVDLDADGLSDVAYVESVTHAVHVFRNTSTPSAPSFASEAQSGSGPYVLPEALGAIFMGQGDLDADGRPDLAVTGNVSGVGSRLHVLRNTGAPGAPLAFAGAGGPWSVSPGGKTSAVPRGLVVAPFDSLSCGSRADVAFSSNNGSAIDFSVQYVHNATE